MIRPLRFAVFPLLLACSSDELSPSWRIDRLRILAVAGDTVVTDGSAPTAEPRPGDTVQFRSLVVSPDPVGAVVWFACASAGSYGCDIDSADLSALSDGSMDTLTPEEQLALFAELQAAGLIGVEPFLPPSYTVPDDYLTSLTEAQRTEGTPIIVNLTAIPDEADVAEADLEIAFKRLPVSEALTPNHNPVITGLRVEGIDLAPGATLTVVPGYPYEIEPILSEGSVEDYTYVNQDGNAEARTEEPYFNWYTKHGSFFQEYSLYPNTSATWYAPAEPPAETDTLWVVVRDRRGGMGWYTLDLRYSL